MSRRSIYFWYFFIALISLFLYGSGQYGQVAKAEGFTVIGTGTPASCQSSSAVVAFSLAVTAGGTIDFDCGPNPVTINVKHSSTDQTVVINGNDLIYLSGEDVRQHFYVKNGGSITLNKVVLMDGAANSGGVASIDVGGTFIMNGGVVMSSLATSNGGAFYNQGSLTLRNATMAQNQAAAQGGGIFNDAGFVDILNSYVSQNKAQHGGAIMNYEGFLYVHQSVFRGNETNTQGAIYADGYTLITNSTFTTNQALQGGALFITV